MTRIIVDLDSTIYDLLTPWIAAYNRDYPHATVESFSNWQVDQCISPDCGVRVYDYLKDEGLYTIGDIYSGAYQTTLQWIEQGYEVGIATRAMTPAAFTGKLKWLAEHLPHIKTTFMLTNDTKGWIKGDIFIDDAPHNLESVDGVRILFDQPHNQDDTPFIRVENWKQIAEIVPEIISMQGLSLPHRYIESKIKESYYDD